MSKSIKLRIRARGPSESPTVDDLLEQLRDYFDILEGVEEAVAGDGRIALQWRIVSASTNSPITIEAVAFPRDFGVDITARAAIVTRQTALGLDTLRRKAERPSYFTEKVLQRAENLFERVTNGLPNLTLRHKAPLDNLRVGEL